MKDFFGFWPKTLEERADDIWLAGLSKNVSQSRSCEIHSTGSDRHDTSEHAKSRRRGLSLNPDFCRNQNAFQGICICSVFILRRGRATHSSPPEAPRAPCTRQGTACKAVFFGGRGGVLVVGSGGLGPIEA